MSFRSSSLSKCLFALTLGIGIAGSLFSQRAKHVVLISIDGFRPDFYQSEEWGTPNMKILARSGASADHVVTIFPSVTYPSHTTLATGKEPKDHGILYNTSIDESKLSGEWITDYHQIKAKTIWEAAKDKKLTTASVSWPIVTSAPYIDYNVPEIWNRQNMIDRVSATRQLSTPKGLFDEAMQKATGELQIQDYNIGTLSMDENLSRIASYILQTYKPALLTIHLPNTDGAEHQSGRTGDNVQRAVSGADHAVSNIIDAIQKAGMSDSTVIIITGDHGFVTTNIGVSPNIWLKQNNLFGKAYFFSTGGSTFLKLRKEVSQKEVPYITNKTMEILHCLPGAQQRYFTTLQKRDIINSGADTSALLALTGANGICFDNKQEGEPIHSASGGKHGYYPNLKEIYTGFILSGPHIKQQTIQELHLTDVAGIVASLLGLDMATSNSYDYLFSN